MRKVCALHPYATDVPSLLKYLNLEGDFNLIWDSESPDILFASEHIYTSRAYFEKFRALYYQSKIKVMLAFEAEKPDWNLFDYAVGFDNKYQDPNRFIRLSSPLDMFHKFISKRENEITSVEKAKEELKKKKSFCNFLYSNPNAHPMRDKLFFEISKYKKVDSLGKHLNNVEQMGTGFVNHAGECVQLKSPYKFSIASENAVYCGYTSEKIFTSLEAHTVPIYFGNPDVCEDVNPEAFINANDFESLESLMTYIKKVDENDDLWCKYVSTPWFTPEQTTYHIKRTKEYNEKLRDLLLSSIDGKSMLSIGTRQAIYRDNILSNMYPDIPKVNYCMITRLKNKIKSLINMH